MKIKKTIQVTQLIDDEEPLVVTYIPSGNPELMLQVYEDHAEHDLQLQRLDAVHARIAEFTVPPTATEAARLGLVPGPFWPDECGHGGYVASYEWYDRSGAVPERCDLYIWWDKDRNEQKACIRFGAEGSQYHSPGHVLGMLQWKTHEPYATAIRILEGLGQIVWQPRKEVIP